MPRRGWRFLTPPPSPAYALAHFVNEETDAEAVKGLPKVLCRRRSRRGLAWWSAARVFQIPYVASGEAAVASPRTPFPLESEVPQKDRLRS